MDATFPARLRLPPHRHGRGCLTVVLHGGFSERIAGLDHECPRAAVLAKPALEPHAEVFAEAGARQIILEPDAAWLERVSPPARLFREITSFRDSGAEVLGWRLADEVRADDAWAPLAAEGLVLELVARAAREATRAPTRRLPSWLRRARDLLHADSAREHSVTDIAAAVDVHPVYLARMFRMYFGASVADYGRRVRLDRAAVRIGGSDAPIASIALEAGFFDQSHFTRWFKRHTGLTPLAYRRARRR